MFALNYFYTTTEGSNRAGVWLGVITEKGDIRFLHHVADAMIHEDHVEVRFVDAHHMRVHFEGRLERTSFTFESMKDLLTHMRKNCAVYKQTALIQIIRAGNV